MTTTLVFFNPSSHSSFLYHTSGALLVILSITSTSYHSACCVPTKPSDWGNQHAPAAKFSASFSSTLSDPGCCTPSLLLWISRLCTSRVFLLFLATLSQPPVWPLSSTHLLMPVLRFNLGPLFFQFPLHFFQNFQYLQDTTQSWPPCLYVGPVSLSGLTSF
jgi:hypothetical protein